MADFTLDTSGEIDFGPHPEIALPDPFAFTRYIAWRDLTPFQQGYVEAAIRSLLDNGGADDARRLGLDFVDLLRFDRLAPEALALILKDCEARVADQPGLGDKAHDGARFHADRQAGAACTAAGRPIPPQTAYLSDDGKVHLRESGQ